MNLEWSRMYYQKNRDRIKANIKRWRKKNPEKCKEIQARWVKKNPEKIAFWNRKHRLARIGKANAYSRKYWNKRMATDMGFKLKQTLRRRMYMAIKQNQKSGSALKLLGCSIPDFKIYIESKWETGMSWENYGKHGWHVDHIMPCAIFDLSIPEHQKRCFHFSNLQPMWAKENWIKNAKVITDQFNLI